jgi:uncharacterized protein YjdB
MGKAPGIVTISYTVSNANGCSKTVKQKDTVLALPVVGPIIGNLNICTGTTSQLSDTTLNGVWSSNNPAVATINGTGLVTGVSNGTAVISYTVTDAAGCTTIVTGMATVAPSPVVDTISTTAPSFDVCVGGTITLKDATPSGAWSSSDLAIATINSAGVVTGVSAGSVDIHYTIINTCGIPVSATKTITVHTVATATISREQPSVCKDAPSPDITFTGANGTAPYTFTYKINGGPISW